MRKITLYLIFIYLTSLLCGCASQSLSPANRAAVHTVNVDSNVVMPKDVTYFGAGQNMAAALGGVVGAIVASSTAAPPIRRIETALKDNDIYVDKILVNEFTAQLQNRKAFQVVANKDPADATFKIKVTQYGLYEHAPLSSELKTVIAVDASLVNKSGTVIWRDIEQVTMLNSPAPAYTLKQYLSNPLLLQDGFTAACSLVSTKLLNNLLEQS